MQRVSVVGNSGSGKSTLARLVAQRLRVPYVELDAIHHLANWTPIDPAEFTAKVSAIAAGEGWVIDGNYRTVVCDGPVWARADTVVWVDLPRRTVMWRIVRRTLRRAARREVLWNGNRERLRNLVSWDPNRSIVRWSWTQHHKYQERFGAARTSPELAHVTFVRVRNRSDIRRLLADADARAHSSSLAQNRSG